MTKVKIIKPTRQLLQGRSSAIDSLKIRSTQLVESTQAQSTPSQTMEQMVDQGSIRQQLIEIGTGGSNPEIVPFRVASILGQSLRLDSCLLAYYWEEQPVPQFSWWVSGDQVPHLPDPISLLKDPTLHALCLGERETSILDAQIAVSNLDRGASDQMMLGISVQFQNSLHGVVLLMRSHPTVWTDPEIDGLKTLSEQVSLTLALAQLQLQQQRQEQYRMVVNQLTMAIRNAVGLPEILKQAVEGTAQALQVDRGMLLRLKYWDPLFKSRPPGQNFRVRATVACEWLKAEGAAVAELSEGESESGQLYEPSSNHSFWISECALCQKLFSQAPQLMVVNHPQELLELNAATSIATIFEPETIGAMLIAPLESQGTILGFLVLQHQHPHLWQSEELQLVELVTAQLSTAIIQAETLRQVQSLVDKRTAQLRQSLELQAKLYEKTRQQIDQLRHLNQMKDDFIDTISHELRTPLTSMTLAIRMLRETGLSSHQSERYLDILEQQCAQEISLVNDLLALQELESRQVPIQLQTVDLSQFIDETVQGFQQRWVAKGLTLQVELPSHPVTLQTDLNSFRSILQELLTNAGKYSNPKSVVNLRVHLGELLIADQVIITLSNIGRGISPEELPYIFEKFRRGAGATRDAIQGTGLGLALVQSLVQHLNGKIAASSTPLEDTQFHETCFTLTLPQVFDLSQQAS